MTARAGARQRTSRTLAGLALAFCTPCRAHLPEGVDRNVASFPWSFEPWILAMLTVSMALFLIGTLRLWRRAGPGRGVGWGAAMAWCAGWSALLVALVSPLDPLGESLFSAHMLQHEMLMVVAAPMLVLARPLAAWTWALPLKWRVAVGALLRRPGWRSTWDTLTHPLTAWSLHALALWGWHLPLLFMAALDHPTIHTLQHLSFLGTALLFWWTTLGAISRRTQGAALASLFTTMMHTAALGALMTLSPLLWYGHYAGTSAIYGLDPLADQQLGGLIMWIPASAAYLAAALALAARWLRERPPPVTDAWRSG